jgi:hypothetical protein
MDRPADRRHLVAAGDEPPGEEHERRDVAGGADRRQRDPHRSDGGDAARRHARAVPRRDDPPDLQQALHPAALPRYGSSSSSIRASSARGSPASAQATVFGMW